MMNLVCALCIATAAHAAGKEPALSAPSGEGPYSKQEMVGAKNPVEDGLPEMTGPLELEFAEAFFCDEDRGLFITVHRGKQLGGNFAVYRRVSGGWRNPGPPRFKRLVELVAGHDAWFEKPTLFSFGSHRLIHVTLRWDGTGHYTEESFWEIASDCSKLVPVKFVPAAVRYKNRLGKGEGVWKGETIYISDNCLAFDYGIWREGDPNCCPSGGEVTGTFDVTSDDTIPEAIQIVPITFDRHATQHGAMPEALCPGKHPAQ